MSAFATTALVLSLLSGALAQSATTSVDSAVLTITANSTGPSGYAIPPLSALTSGAAIDSTVALVSTYTAGAAATAVSGAPPLPTSALTIANYPALDVTPPINSTEVQGWLSKMDMTKIPGYNITTGDCSTDPGAISDGRCWWTCGGCTRETDITECPDKFTWGLSYDDGPSPYTPLLIDYLAEVNVKTTFFLVGSRVLSRPEIVQTEYMAGHQLSVHTWSHAALTTLSNEQIVAELGWTMKVIKDVTGVTPNTFRPPYGDIDDRVRAVAAQMGLTPIIWTSYKANGTDTNFDTNDWHISGGTATGASSYETFEQILNQYVPALDTGFIVLAHDIYQQTVDLAVGYVLPQAIASGKFQLKSIIDCLGRPLSEAYIETSSNSTATVISSAPSGTFFQPSIGTATGAVVTPTSASPTSGGAAASGSGASGAGSGTTAGAASSSSAASSAGQRVQFGNVVPGLFALGAVAAGMALAA
ncbi:hypothetical protein CI109_105779 [Kwoniella shandongensis]|uniref:chitin deacetylase n=1 Tax=Kwoniella shandongensis TaxID=1734106 RepID=A0A5M6C0A9_9TREE|nr:uncharacterized protein CI109_003118 [Kwoniella shandongensis]KAA5528586.1 hypothetical protein CI109_003118 [Kwoniella shandongensis]